MIRSLVVLATVAGCGITVSRPATHPAMTSAPTGRLAGPPPALRPGVIAYPDVPPLRPPSDDHPPHHHGT